MKKTWRSTLDQVPNDDFLVLVSQDNGDKTLARYYEDMWICEFTNRVIFVEYWMPIPLTPTE